MLYLVKLRRELEWENYYEADNEGVAVDLAKLEAHHGFVTDEQVIVEQVEEALGWVD